MKPKVNGEELVEALVVWFGSQKRDLPWRRGGPGARDGYAALVSEAMLQQTQVSRVIEKFERFIARFPNISSLALASEDDVLSAWAGLGYYRRARHLHAAARRVAESYEGIVPRRVEDLLTLPGVGRYTAGAIASIAYNQPAGIVDGNVSRVLLRIFARPGSADDKLTIAWAWAKAEELAAAAGKRVGSFNEAMMELGATVCTPGPAPACERCPAYKLCGARKAGLTATIPSPKARARVQARRWLTLVVTDSRGRVLVGRRRADGLWARLWQTPTLEHASGEGPESLTVQAWLNTPEREGPLKGIAFTYVGECTRTLTHRKITFAIYTGRAAAASRALKGAITCTGGGEEFQGEQRRWADEAEILTLGMSNAQLAVLAQWRNGRA